MRDSYLVYAKARYEVVLIFNEKLALISSAWLHKWRRFLASSIQVSVLMITDYIDNHTSV